MNAGRARTTLIALSLVQALGEFITAPMIEVWMFSLAFGVLFVLAAYLVRRGRLVAGVVIDTVLSLFLLANYPFWDKTGAFDWILDTAIALAAAATLGAAVWALVERRRTVASTPSGTR